jgi:hypothetical protein
MYQAELVQMRHRIAQISAEHINPGKLKRLVDLLKF